MAGEKRISISDVAKAVGVSITTVSFILNGKAKERRISEAVNRRVLDYVKQVGYKPSRSIRKAGGKAKVLAFLSENIADPFFSEVGRHIETLAAELGYQVLYCDTRNDVNRANQYIQLCIEKEIEGLIVVPPENFEKTAEKMKQRIPMVMFDRYLPTVETSYVVSDNRTGAYNATKYLLEQGNKRIGLVSLYSSHTHIRGRLDGYMEAMDEFRMQSFIRKLSADSPAAETAIQIAEFLVDNKLDAVLFATHCLAVDGLSGIREKDIVMPRIVTFDDHVLFNHYRPAISAVVQDVEQLAKKLLETLAAEIKGKPEAISKIVVPCKLEVRESLIF
ncbi:LacI family DNA-binding transcriptional regulator [Sphingobacterium haloxyli]|nr:LacI family DNA-binding transcriptional regulator [Sphingobacterium haloxyli]